MLLKAEEFKQHLRDDLSGITGDVAEFAANHMAAEVLRKLSGSSSTDEQDSIALASFKTRNDGQWDGTHFIGCSAADRTFYTLFQEEVDRFFTTSEGSILHSWDYVHHKGRMGPRASVGCQSYSLYGKLFASPLGGSNETLRFVHNRIVSRDRRWAEAEAIRFQLFGSDDGCESRVSFVPKNVDTSRTIATEPPLNMFFQLGMGQIIAERLQKYGIDIWGDNGWGNTHPVISELWRHAAVRHPRSILSQPEVNRLMARRGSLDGSLATIDLSAASDSISALLVRDVVPRSTLCFLEAARTPRALLPDGTTCTLEMFSTMGNGFTFPLQTALFLCVVLATYRFLRIAPKLFGDPSTRNIGVFGDDIIVENGSYEAICHNLAFLGFSVNGKKSFNTGSFRESCGGDFYKGHLVRPAYIKGGETVQDLYIGVNALTDWTATTGISLQRSSGYLLDRLNWFDRDVLCIPPHDGADAGLRVPTSLVHKSQVRRSKQGTVRYQAYRPIRNEQGVDQLVQSRHFPVNIPGLYLAFLRNTLVDGKLTWRRSPRETHYHRRTVVTPCWDVLPGRASREAFTRWEGAALSNLG